MKAVSKTQSANRIREGWHGWDEYAPFYDWENARTLGRRDVPFWCRVASTGPGPVLELGCGTGRMTMPLARAGVEVVGVDRSAAMLGRARRRLSQRHRAATSHSQVGPRRYSRACRSRTRTFPMVLAPYGILQSLTRPRDLSAALASVARVIAPGGTFGLDLVPDVPNWREYRNRVQLRGRSAGGHLTLIESVRQDPKRRLTTFEQRYVERRGAGEARASVRADVPDVDRAADDAAARASGICTIDRCSATIAAAPWDARADVWIILAKKV